ncbi:MAG: endonuclease [Cyanobacteria bacterium P01_A01_bin.40]
MMTLTPAALGLIAVFVIGYLAAISFGTWAYFANEKDY